VFDDRRPDMTYMWTDPGVVRAVVDNNRPALHRRQVDQPPRRKPEPASRLKLSGLPAARPTEARGT
jgi:hypothetical protein